MKSDLKEVYLLSSAYLSKTLSCNIDELPRILASRPDLCQEAPFLADLAKIELTAFTLTTTPPPVPVTITERMIHPGLELIEVNWQGLPEYILNQDKIPVRGKSLVLILPSGQAPSLRIITPTEHELLALKIVAESLDTELIAREEEVSIGWLDNILYNAVQKGLLLAPPPKIIRPTSFCSEEKGEVKQFSSPAFTLQWHITQACDLRCRHCYDRSNRTEMTMEQGIQVLDDLYHFCHDHHVYGQVTFTGGNPFLSPHFYPLYQEAADRGFLTAVLGNPVDRSSLDKMIAIQTPEFYQVSLEGLQQHNDHIRGEGHYQRVMEFLDLLRKAVVYSMVMLTLTRANLKQVLPLAELLKGRADLFTFNRLAMVGEGAALASVATADYRTFLESFAQAAEHNPSLSLKDNLFNLVLHEQKKPLRGGCTGYGCGAAFNFVSLLPDGEVHACRKFPSPIGNIHTDSLTNIYHSAQARGYRRGSSSCSNCEIQPVCGGCLAVSYGFGRDIFTEVDPYCFHPQFS